MEEESESNKQKALLQTTNNEKLQLEETIKMKEVEKEELQLNINALKQQHHNEMQKKH